MVFLKKNSISECAYERTIFFIIFVTQRSVSFFFLLSRFFNIIFLRKLFLPNVMRFFQNKLLLSIKVDERNEAWHMSIESIFTFSPPRIWPVIRPVNVHLNVLTDCATSMILTATTVQYPSNNTQTIQRMGTFESISSLNLAPPFHYFHHNFSFVNKSYLRTDFLL